MIPILATSFFLIAYVFIASEKFNRVAIVLAGASGMVIIGATDAEAIFYNHSTGIDWNVIFLLLGMMIIVSVIHKTGLFEYLAVRAIQVAKGEPKRAFIYILILVAVASALLDNVTTILLAVPMSFLIAKYLNVSAVPFVIGEVFVSNIGGAATLIGDPPNIIIGSKVGLNFNDFLVHMAPAATLTLLVVIPMLVWMFRKELVNKTSDRSSISELVASDFISNRNLLLKSLVTLSLVIIGFVGHSIFHVEPSLIAMIGAGLLISLSGLKPADYAMDVEWETLVFFAGLFIMVGALVNVNVLQNLAEVISDAVGSNAALAGGSLVVVSAALSGVVDNIPYVASMIPVVEQINLGLPTLTNDGLWWALALGADFGGNLTIIGASANVVAIGLAHANGIKISFWQFAKYGFPVTIVSTAIALPYVLIRYF